MENKINIAELLKDCPSGMELDCTMYDNCTFEGIEDVGYIDILVKTPSGIIRLTKEGCYIRHDDYAKCVIFPKGKTTWEGFVPPVEFEDGDILAIDDTVYIYNGMEELSPFPKHYVYVITDNNGLFAINASTKKYGTRFATEEEKQELFQAIKANGYYWDAETKALVKLPRFKAGDRIKKGEKIATIVRIYKNYYDVRYDNGIGSFTIDLQDEWELLPNKFDITTLKPFDKVLVRDKNIQEWCISFFSHCNGLETYKYSCINGSGYAQCIPYTEDTKHLVGTTNDCDDFYKTW